MPAETVIGIAVSLVCGLCIGCGYGAKNYHDRYHAPQASGNNRNSFHMARPIRLNSVDSRQHFPESGGSAPVPPKALRAERQRTSTMPRRSSPLAAGALDQGQDGDRDRGRDRGTSRARRSNTVSNNSNHNRNNSLSPHSGAAGAGTTGVQIPGRAPTPIPILGMGLGFAVDDRGGDRPSSSTQQSLTVERPTTSLSANSQSHQRPSTALSVNGYGSQRPPTRGSGGSSVISREATPPPPYSALACPPAVAAAAASAAAAVVLPLSPLTATTRSPSPALTGERIQRRMNSLMKDLEQCATAVDTWVQNTRAEVERRAGGSSLGRSRRYHHHHHHHHHHNHPHHRLRDGGDDGDPGERAEDGEDRGDREDRSSVCASECGSLDERTPHPPGERERRELEFEDAERRAAQAWGWGTSGVSRDQALQMQTQHAERAVTPAFGYGVRGGGGSSTSLSISQCKDTACIPTATPTPTSPRFVRPPPLKLANSPRFQSSVPNSAPMRGAEQIGGSFSSSGDRLDVPPMSAPPRTGSWDVLASSSSSVAAAAPPLAGNVPAPPLPGPSRLTRVATGDGFDAAQQLHMLPRSRSQTMSQMQTLAQGQRRKQMLPSPPTSPTGPAAMSPLSPIGGRIISIHPETPVSSTGLRFVEMDHHPDANVDVDADSDDDCDEAEHGHNDKNNQQSSSTVSPPHLKLDTEAAAAAAGVVVVSDSRQQHHHPLPHPPPRHHQKQQHQLQQRENKRISKIKATNPRGPAHGRTVELPMTPTSPTGKAAAAVFALPELITSFTSSPTMMNSLPDAPASLSSPAAVAAASHGYTSSTSTTASGSGSMPMSASSPSSATTIQGSVRAGRLGKDKAAAAAAIEEAGSAAVEERPMTPSSSEDEREFGFGHEGPGGHGGVGICGGGLSPVPRPQQLQRHWSKNGELLDATIAADESEGDGDGGDGGGKGVDFKLEHVLRFGELEAGGAGRDDGKWKVAATKAEGAGAGGGGGGGGREGQRVGDRVSRAISAFGRHDTQPHEREQEQEQDWARKTGEEENINKMASGQFIGHMGGKRPAFF